MPEAVEAEEKSSRDFERWFSVPITRTQSVRHNRNHAPVIFATVSVVSCLLVLACGSGNVNSAAIEKQLAAAIPPGATVDHVVEYLNLEKVEHSEYRRDATPRTISAMIRDESRFALVKTSYQIVFHFDEHDRLVSYSVRPVYTGP